MEQDVNKNTQQAEAQQPAQAPAPTVPEVPSAPTPVMNSPKKDNNLLIILGLIVVMALVLGGLYFYTMSASTKPTPAKTSVVTQTKPTVTPIPSPVMDETKLDTLDTGDPTVDLNSIDTDLQQL